MKCILCNERNGSTRCEGCQQLYCLPCMNKHHDELAHQFQLLTNVRNELKQSLDGSESTSKNNKEVLCIVEIDRWERESVQRIRDIARKARTNVNEIMTKNMAEMHRRFEQLSVDIQRRQKEGNYLETDIDSIKSQLEQLRNDIEYVTKKVHLDCTISENTEWDTLISVVDEDLRRRPTFKFAKATTQSTREEKMNSSTSKYSRFFRKIPYSSIDVPARQPRTEQQNPRRPPTQLVKVESLSNSSGFGPNLDMVDQYIVCPTCTYTQPVKRTQNGMEHVCEMCESILRLTDL